MYVFAACQFNCSETSKITFKGPWSNLDIFEQIFFPLLCLSPETFKHLTRLTRILCLGLLPFILNYSFFKAREKLNIEYSIGKTDTDMPFPDHTDIDTDIWIHIKPIPIYPFGST